MRAAEGTPELELVAGQVRVTGSQAETCHWCSLVFSGCTEHVQTWLPVHTRVTHTHKSMSMYIME